MDAHFVTRGFSCIHYSIDLQNYRNTSILFKWYMTKTRIPYPKRTCSESKYFQEVKNSKIGLSETMHRHFDVFANSTCNLHAYACNSFNYGGVASPAVDQFYIAHFEIDGSLI